MQQLWISLHLCSGFACLQNEPSDGAQAAARLSTEEGKFEAASKARSQAEAETARLREDHRLELEGQRVHYTGLLSKANSAQAGPPLLAVLLLIQAS